MVYLGCEANPILGNGNLVQISEEVTCRGSKPFFDRGMPDRVNDSAEDVRIPSQQHLRAA